MGNAHLFWDPAFAGVKLAQAQAVTKEVQRLEEKYGPMYTLLCGDFNSLPGTRELCNLALCLHAAVLCSTQQYAATRCNMLQHSAIRCNTLQYAAIHCCVVISICFRADVSCVDRRRIFALQHIATPCNTLQHPATPSYTLLYPATLYCVVISIRCWAHVNYVNWRRICTLQHTTTHCNTLHRAATCCNTLYGDFNLLHT